MSAPRIKYASLNRLIPVGAASDPPEQVAAAIRFRLRSMKRSGCGATVFAADGWVYAVNSQSPFALHPPVEGLIGVYTGRGSTLEQIAGDIAAWRDERKAA